MLIPIKTITCFGNNKPWTTKHLNPLLNHKKSPDSKKHGNPEGDKTRNCRMQWKRANNISNSKWITYLELAILEKHGEVASRLGVNWEQMEFSDELNRFYTRDRGIEAGG